MKTLLTALLLALSASAQEEPMAELHTAVFAGGCFWCMEPPFAGLPGVKSVEAGYTGGHVKHPSYEEICGGRTGHYEAVRIVFDPDSLSYGQLLEIFWKNIDPTDSIGQFADRGDQYRTAVFVFDEAQRAAAESSRAALAASGVFDKPVVTQILPAAEFWPAEDHHQDYWLKQPMHYNAYKVGSGRAGFLKRIWGP
jgi:methionine-S-sulfoxide reductase